MDSWRIGLHLLDAFPQLSFLFSGWFPDRALVYSLYGPVAAAIPIVATQSISSLHAVLGQSEAWRALLQTLRTRIFLSLADDSSAQIASTLCGQVARMKASYTVSEQTQRAGASLLSGSAGGGTGSVGASKAFSERREPVPSAGLRAARQLPSHRRALRRQPLARRPALLPQARLPAARAPTGAPARPESWRWS